MRSLFGDVDLAFAELRTAFWDMPVEDNAFVALRPRSGGFAWLHASWTEWKNLFSFEVMLERAKIEVNGLGGSYGPERLTLYEMQPEMGPPPATTWEFPPTDLSWQPRAGRRRRRHRRPRRDRRVASTTPSRRSSLIEEAYRP